MSKEQWLRKCRRAERSFSTFKVRRGGPEETPLIKVSSGVLCLPPRRRERYGDSLLYGYLLVEEWRLSHTVGDKGNELLYLKNQRCAYCTIHDVRFLKTECIFLSFVFLAPRKVPGKSKVDTEPLFEFPETYREFLLAIYFTCGNVLGVNQVTKSSNILPTWNLPFTMERQLYVKSPHLGPNCGGDNEDNETSFKRSHACTPTLSALNHAAGPTPTRTSTGDSWTLTGKSGSVSCGVTAPFSWVPVHKFNLEPQLAKTEAPELRAMFPFTMTLGKTVSNSILNFSTLKLWFSIYLFKKCSEGRCRNDLVAENSHVPLNVDLASSNPKQLDKLISIGQKSDLDQDLFQNNNERFNFPGGTVAKHSSANAGDRKTPQAMEQLNPCTASTEARAPGSSDCNY
ncbi:hypothetical protein MG293_000579 [Ovis ammon polii]|uniref:Uncharacterized protein n=1 Tax=Ovis ammon polii TaxID=230172 RepID=A0AAD4UNW3_OVIAM|nr:hypothetical protein MG293_000579 [Ovis ammon polii]